MNNKIKKGLVNALRKNLKRRKKVSGSSVIVKKNILLVLVLMLLSSCTSHTERNGYYFDNKLLNNIKEGKSDQNTVIENLGSPTMIYEIDGTEVYTYMSRDYLIKAFFKPRLINQETIVMYFDNKKLLKKIKIYSMSDQQPFDYDSSKTTFVDRKLDFWKSVVSQNLGRFNSAAQRKM